MHASSLENMQTCYERYVCGEYLNNKQQLLVLDIGGANVNGSYADIFSQEKFKYMAADLSAGNGVDVILDDPYILPFDNASVDILISGQAFEHVEFFWLLFEEMVRVIKNDGWIFLIAPSGGPIHRYPVDCYRFYPDAYHALAKYTNIKLINVFHDQRGPWQDLVGVFSKTEKRFEFDFSTWQALQDSEKNRYLREKLPASINIQRQSDEIEKIQGKASYLDTLNLLHNKLTPKHYVEIGVRKGGSLSLAQCPATIIDPEPDIDMTKFKQAELFQMPSDHFFEHYAVQLENQPFDLAFIDGMHLFEFVLRDFINIESHSCTSTVVVIDDIFPNHILQASRKRVSQVWTGDVWKILLCLKEYRPDLNLMMLDCIPTGLLIITGLNKKNRTLINQYNPIIRRFNELSAKDYHELIFERNEAKDPTDINFEKYIESLAYQKQKNGINLNLQLIKKIFHSANIN